MKLKYWRQSKGLSVDHAASLFGISHHTLRSYERGVRRPRREIAESIQSATNGEVTAAELLGLNATGVNETPNEFEHARTIQVELNDADLKDAAKYGLDAKAIARKAVEEEVKTARLRAWIAENKTAFDAHAKDVEENGLWSDGLRQF